MDVNLNVTIELGRTKHTLEQVLNLGEQSLVELDKQVGDPIDILVNGKIFARGEVVTVSENFGVRITELVTSVAKI
jgi:flagellar motor switch protein FliN/FliY